MYLFILFICLFDRDNAVKHSYKLAADVMHIEFIASANSQLQSSMFVCCTYGEVDGQFRWYL